MTVQERLREIIDELPEERLRQLLDFAEVLEAKDERAAWQAFGRQQFARAYGENEPNYDNVPLKPWR
ncbi:MAG: hypothetical protein ABIQ47_09490 [Tepidiformaceae bacterium]